MKNTERTPLFLVMHSWSPKEKEISFFLQHLQNYFFLDGEGQYLKSAQWFYTVCV